MEPFEVIAAPGTVWLAAAGTTCPDIDDESLAGFVQLGTLDHYNDDGVVIELEQDIGKFTPSGLTEATKAWRTSEGRKVSFSLADLSPEVKAQAVDGVVDVTVAAAGIPGKKSVVTRRGTAVATYTLLVRGASAENELMNAQLYEPKVFQSANVSAALKKGSDPAVVAFTFETLYDDANDPAWEDQTADAV
jgi:hypothetical protein